MQPGREPAVIAVCVTLDLRDGVVHAVHIILPACLEEICEHFLVRSLLYGLRVVDIYLDKLGLSCDDKDRKMEIVRKIKERAYELNGLLTLEDFEKIARRVLA